MSVVRCVAALVLAVVAACGSGSTPAPPSPAVARPLLTVESRGGLCPDGLCRRVVEIDSDGTIRRLVPRTAVVGQLAAPFIERLTTEIARAEFSRLEQRPFVGVCPVAFDGQEIVYTFHLPAGDHVIASCKVEVDPEDPLFSAADAAIRAAGGF
jgi:hypothetical protein